MQDKKTNDDENSFINVPDNSTPLKNLHTSTLQHPKIYSKNSSYKNSFLGTCGIALFLGGRKEIVNFFKVHSFSHNPHLFDIRLSLGLIITLATIRTLASTLIKVDYIRYHSHKKEAESKDISSEEKKSSAFTRWVVYINGFIAASAIFIPTYKTFKELPFYKNLNYYLTIIICWGMVIYAVSSSIYSSINFATPLINQMAHWFFLAIFGTPSERIDARKLLRTIFFRDKKRKFKFFITTVGTITSSFFLFYTIHNTFQLALSLPFECFTGCASPDYLWTISGAAAVFVIFWVLIPFYSLTFREEAKEILHEGVKSPTPKFEALKARCGDPNNKLTNIISFTLFYFFISIGVVCWLVCSLVLSVGTYIGAQHIFGSFAYSTSTIISDAIFVIDFLYQLNYYSTELSRKISNKLMTYMPYSHVFFKAEKQNKQDQLQVGAINVVNNNIITLK